MMRDPASIPELVSDLRQAFDLAFAAAPSTAAAGAEDLLEVQCGSAAYVLRLGEIAALTRDLGVTAIPSAAPAFLGVAGVRGAILAVYDLAALLGQPPDPAPRWIAIAAGVTPVGLAFRHVDGHRRVPAASILAQSRPDGVARHVRGVARLDGGVRPIVSISSVVDAIAERGRVDGEQGAASR